MAEKRALSETQRKFVEQMLSKADKKYETPQPNKVTDVDLDEVEKLTKSIQQRIQRS
jgi:hypothetical protein